MKRNCEEEAPYISNKKDNIRFEYFPPEFSQNHFVEVTDYSNPNNPKTLLSFSLKNFLSECGYKIVKKEVQEK